MSSCTVQCSEQDADRIACISVEEGKDVRGQKTVQLRAGLDPESRVRQQKAAVIATGLGWYKVEG
jgi:hypothetical protein